MVSDGGRFGVALGARAGRDPAGVELAGKPNDAGLGADERECRVGLIFRGDERGQCGGRQVDGSNATVPTIRDEEVARGVEGEPVRRAQLGGGGRAAVPAEAVGAGAGDRGDNPVGRHPADAEVALVSDVEDARRVESDAVRDAQPSAGGGVAVAAEAGVAGAGDGRDDPVGRHLADAEVALVRDVEVARRVEGDVVREVQLGGGGGALVATKAGNTGAGKRGDDPVGRHPADAVVRGVGDEEIARGVYGDAGRGLELGGSRQAAVATEAGPTGAGDGRDDPGVGRHPADAVVVGVGDEEVARGVHGDAGRGLELGGGRQAVVAEEAGSAGAGDRADVPARRDLADAVVVGVGNEKVTRGVDGDTGRGR